MSISDEPPQAAKPAPSARANAAGIIVPDGADLSIQGFRIIVPADGAFRVKHDGFALRMDLVRHWLRIGTGHVAAARRARLALEVAATGQAKEAYPLLEAEFHASMQAVTAAAISIDALYSHVKERIDVPALHQAAWAKNQTARWKQTSEVFRLAFTLANRQDYRGLREGIREIFRFRDWAVHPPADSRLLVHNAVLGRATEWRFSAFRYENARTAMRSSLALAHNLSAVPQAKWKHLKTYCENLHAATSALVNEWRREFPDP